MSKISSIDFHQVQIHKLRKNLFDIKNFKCKKHAYEKYLKTDAFEDQEQSVGQTWVFVYKKKNIIGYVSIAMAQLHKSQHQKLGQFPHANVPALLLGQLATHQDYEGLGVGQRIVQWVIYRGTQYSEDIGCRIIVLNPEKDVIDWYKKKLGFVYIPHTKKQDVMFYDLATIMNKNRKK